MDVKWGGDINEEEMKKGWNIKCIWESKIEEVFKEGYKYKLMKFMSEK